MDLELEGKMALVTGGSKGIGRAIALGLAAEGARVNPHDAQTTASGAAHFEQKLQPSRFAVWQRGNYMRFPGLAKGRVG